MSIRLKYALFVGLLLIAVLWLVKLWETSFHSQFYLFGIYPRTIKGLRGILFSPFIHADFKHLYSNSIPLFLLTVGLFYFYPEKAWKVLLVSWLGTGFIVWIIARPAYHIGASGVVYALTSYFVFAGIFSGRKELIALSLVVIFLYGSSIWGMLPSFAFDRSWEAHAAGYFIGFLLALGEKRPGPQPPQEKRFLEFRSGPDWPGDFDYEYKE